MALKCGIIGITNSGKTTLFNCISKTKAEATNYAFSTNKSNLGMVEVPDPRITALDEIVKAQRVVLATMEIVDIPGLAKGASQGEGVGNTFLADIQQTDALIHVLRCFDDENLPHVEGSVDPARDIEIVEFELQARDLDLVTRKIQRLEKLAKTGEKTAKRSLELVNRYKAHLEDFQSIRTMEVDEEMEDAVKELGLLTSKPVIYVCNVNDEFATGSNPYVEAVKEALKEENTEILTIAGRLEAEIAELDDEEDRIAFLDDAGLTEPGVDRVVRSAYSLLNLQSYFTVGVKEIRAWTIRKGTLAPQAAGVIHSDLERGFIRAEVISYDDYVKYKTEPAVKEAGKFRVEGKTYEVQDGDCLNIRFNV